MELADMQDLGAVTLGKVFPVPHLLANGKYRFACSYKCGLSVTLHLGQPPRVRIRGTKEYAGVVELADSTDLGSVTSVVCGFKSRRPHHLCHSFCCGTHCLLCAAYCGYSPPYPLR